MLEAMKELIKQKAELCIQSSGVEGQIRKIQLDCPHLNVQDIPGPEAGKTDSICQDCDKWM